MIDFVIQQQIRLTCSIIQELKIDTDPIYDLVTISILMTGSDDKMMLEEKMVCWKILSIIRELYKPVCSVTKGWVSTPKESGYESLYVTLSNT